MRRLAAFDTPRDVCVAFKTLFPQTACTENDIIAVDPRNSPLPAPDVVALFNSERARVLGDPNSAPYADQQARLIVLSKDVERYRANNDLANARSVLRQIADELQASGKVTPGADGEPVAVIERRIIDPNPAN